jgi:HK97 family phage major capsid protein
MAFTPTASASQSDRLAQQQAFTFEQMRLMMATATQEGRPFTDAEEQKFNTLKEEHASFDRRITQATSDENLRAQFDAITRGGESRRAGSASPTGHGGSSPGQMFATNTQIREFIAGGGHRRAQAWLSPSVEISRSALDFRATTLTEDAASGGKLITPQYLPGVIPVATRATIVADLMASGMTDSNAITYMVETLFTNSAAPVLEGAAKPESAMAFDQKTDLVSKIAHWLPVTEELLEDVAAIASYIDSRLRTGVQLAEDDQLLHGNGTPPNLLGLLNRPGLAPTVVQAAGESAADAILRQVGLISTTAMVPATAVVLNPLDYFVMLAAKTSGSGEYLGGGPFEGSNQTRLWGLPIALTTAISPKMAVVGAFGTQSQIFRKGGIRVEASNSHQDFFIKNLVAIRAEERLALAVYRPAAFGKVTLL